MRDQSAKRDAPKIIHQRPDCLQHRSAHILEIHVNSFGACRLQALKQLRIAMIHPGVKTKIVHQVLAFLPASRNSNCVAALDFCNLSHHRTDCA